MTELQPIISESIGYTGEKRDPNGAVIPLGLDESAEATYPVAGDAVDQELGPVGPAAPTDSADYPSEERAEAAPTEAQPAAANLSQPAPARPAEQEQQEAVGAPAPAENLQEAAPVANEDENIQGAFVAPYILRFVATNNENCSLGFECRVIYKDPADVNFAPVCGGIQAVVRSKGQVPYLTLTKLDPSKDWGDFEIEVFITQIETASGSHLVTKKTSFRFKKEAKN